MGIAGCPNKPVKKRKYSLHTAYGTFLYVWLHLYVYPYQTGDREIHLLPPKLFQYFTYIHRLMNFVIEVYLLPLNGTTG